LFKICANDYVSELNKSKTTDHIFKSYDNIINFRSEHFSFINIKCVNCFLRSSLTITNDIKMLLDNRSTILTETGKTSQLKIKLFTFNSETCFSECYDKLYY